MLAIGCAEEKKEGLIPGVELTGDALTDALVLAVVANPPCTILTSSNGSTAVDLSDGFDSICSSTTSVATFTVPSSGEYEVVGSTGRQTLTSPRCNSSNFTIHVQLDQGVTALYTTRNTPGQAATLNLTAGTSYTIYGSGIVDPGDYTCSGARPSSSITPYRINIRKK
ncbi:hypothetical protein JWG41_10810 [Leptospira sp. 201903075]|uniref:hypothetical protein n=1 Tax=Leptospira chreensis TaxID=2810035 RepID=UPI001963A97F|nr:hypothetical protein [Leptospira chreensis]MBM9590938.1 hypothetical protein [Leptospira chreensis]